MTTPRTSALVERLKEELGALEPEEVAYALALLKSDPTDPLEPAQMSLDLALIRLLPRSLAYYAERAEEARWRRVNRKWRARHA
jgi:hypothetical protein